MDAKLNIKEFTKLYQSYYVALYGMTLAIVSKKAIAEDICKETFKEAVFKIDPLMKPDEKAETLFSSAREKGLEVINSRARKVEWTDVLEGEVETDKRKDVDDMLLLIGGISNFDSKQRQITVLKAKGFSDQLIANIMDLPKQSIIWLASQCKLEIKNAGKDYKVFENDVVEVLDKNAHNCLDDMLKECADIFRTGKNAVNTGKIVKTILIILLVVVLIVAVGFAVYYLVNNRSGLREGNNEISTTNVQVPTAADGQNDYAGYGFDTVNVNCELPKDSYSIYKPMADDSIKDKLADYFTNTLGINVELSADDENEGYSSYTAADGSYRFSVNDKYGFFEFKYNRYTPQPGEQNSEMLAACDGDAQRIIADLAGIYGEERFPQLAAYTIDTVTEADENVEDTSDSTEVNSDDPLHYEFTFVPAETISVDGVEVEEYIKFDYDSEGHLVSLSSNIYSGDFEAFGAVPVDDTVRRFLAGITEKGNVLEINSITPVYRFDGDLFVPSLSYSYTVDGNPYTVVLPLKQ